MKEEPDLYYKELLQKLFGFHRVRHEDDYFRNLMGLYEKVEDPIKIHSFGLNKTVFHIRSNN